MAFRICCPGLCLDPAPTSELVGDLRRLLYEEGVPPSCFLHGPATVLHPQTGHLCPRLLLSLLALLSGLPHLRGRCALGLVTAWQHGEAKPGVPPRGLSASKTLRQRPPGLLHALDLHSRPASATQEPFTEPLQKRRGVRSACLQCPLLKFHPHMSRWEFRGNSRPAEYLQLRVHCPTWL